MVTSVSQVSAVSTAVSGTQAASVVATVGKWPIPMTWGRTMATPGTNASSGSRPMSMMPADSARIRVAVDQAVASYELNWFCSGQLSPASARNSSGEPPQDSSASMSMSTRSLLGPRCDSRL